MKGLDDFIMGVHDPNAPFNQTDWTEDFECVLAECFWLNFKTLDIDKTYRELGRLMDKAVNRILKLDEPYDLKFEPLKLSDYAKEIAECFRKEVSDEIKLFKAKWFYVIETLENPCAPFVRDYRFKNGKCVVNYSYINTAKLFLSAQKAYDSVLKISNSQRYCVHDVVKVLIFL